MIKRTLVAVTALAILIALWATSSSASAVEHSPAEADPALVVPSTPGPDIRLVRSPPTWVKTDNATIDWKWFKGGWEIRFSKRETSYIGVNAGLCSALLGAFGHPVFRVLAAGCGILSWYASTLVVRSRCLNVFVPLRIAGGFSVGSRAC